MAVSADLFREVFRRWPSGVGIVTTVADGHVHGMVIGSFCSLSAAPPLVMFSAGHTTRTHAMVEQGGIFAVSILTQHQIEHFERFAGFNRDHDLDRFAGLVTATAETGAPVFPDALAWVDCRVAARHEGVTYSIFVGEVVAASLGSEAEAPPLVYFKRQRRRLDETGS